jgi:hypothetical protein
MVWSFLPFSKRNWNIKKAQINFKVILLLAGSCTTADIQWIIFNLHSKSSDLLNILLYSNLKTKINLYLKTLAISRYLINSSSHLGLLFFFWFEEITFPWILTQMKVKWKYRTIISKNEMNGPTVKCTMNHNCLGNKKTKAKCGSLRSH